jgi:hypothetical protein
MKSDRARYDDGELVFCRTCGGPIQKPNPARFNQHLSAHHRWCPVRKTIACDAPVRELSDNTWEVCGRPATFWSRKTELCYCDDHGEGLRGLQPISEMPKRAVQCIQARQLTERSVFR